MKTLFLFIVTMSVLTEFCYSQQIRNTVLDTCFKKKYASNSISIDKDRSIDTLSFTDFCSIVNDIWFKVSERKTFSIEDDRKILLIINTNDWGKFDKKDNILKKISNLKLLSYYFYSVYFKQLFCKYTAYLLSGVYPYFYDLKIQHSGNPYECARYFIKD